jgi:hypothetical protein
MGSLAAAGAAGIGTGAVSPGTTFSRSSEVTVAETDKNATIALIEGDNDSDLVSYDENGRLNIDLASSGGANPDSVYKIGTQANPAFKIQNNDPDSQIIAFDYDADNFTDLHQGADTQITFIFYGVDDSTRGNSYAMWLGSGAGQDPSYNAYFEIGAGSSVDVTMQVKAPASAAGEDLSGQMEFEVVDSIPDTQDHQS